MSEAKDLYYLPLLKKELASKVDNLAKKLRLNKEIISKDGEFKAQVDGVLVSLDEQKITKALEFANKKNISKIIILGEEEVDKGIYKVKNMRSGEEKEFEI